MTVDGTESMTAEGMVSMKAVSTKDGIKWMIGRNRCMNVRRAGGHEDTCDIKNDCPA